MSKLEIHQFICRDDNFCVLLHDPETGQCVSIDAPEETAIQQVLDEKNWSLTHILITHWHFDHVDGVEGLKSRYNCQVIGPKQEADKIKLLDKLVDDGDKLYFGSDTVRVISTPGHTLGMVNFHFLNTNALFTGDTLFALGCGRVFEGDGPMMWNSIQKLAELPPQTKVYCGHEYTIANGNFALSIDPENANLKTRMEKFTALRQAGKPTLPTTIGEELATNPFMRPADKNIRKHLNMEEETDSEVFSTIRTLKDQF